MCPNPNVKVCFACGTANPGPNHEKECVPHCKLCGGKHPTGTPGCTNRYKTPYVVTRRRWERKHEAQQQPPPLSLATFPQLMTSGAPAAERRSRSRHRSSSRRRSKSRRRSASHSKRQSRSRDRVAWADVIRAPDSKPPQRPQPRDEMFAALRLENEQLRQKVAEQDATITAINAKLSQLLALQQPKPPRQQTPTPPPQPALPPPRAPEPQSQISESFDDDEMTESTVEPNPHNDKTSEPTPKKRALDTTGRKQVSTILARLDQHDEAISTINERLTTVEARLTTVEARLTTIEQTCQAIQGNMQAMQATLLQIQTYLSIRTEAPGNHDTTQQQRPTWPEHR